MTVAQEFCEVTTDRYPIWREFGYFIKPLKEKLFALRCTTCFRNQSSFNPVTWVLYGKDSNVRDRVFALCTADCIVRSGFSSLLLRSQLRGNVLKTLMYRFAAALAEEKYIYMETRPC